MYLSRQSLACMAMGIIGSSAISAVSPYSSGSDWDSMLWNKPKRLKEKPNRVSQAKKRKYQRQRR